MSRYVIGDIHGCADELRYLIEALPLARGDRLVFLGDYIDRGPDSRGVVSFLIALQNSHRELEFVFLKGNHEDMLLSYLGLNGLHGDMVLVNGGKPTFESYGVATSRPSPHEVLAAIPSEHLIFLERLESYHVMDPFL